MRRETYDSFSAYIVAEYLPSKASLVRASKFLLGALVMFTPLFTGIIIGGLLAGASGVMWGMGAGFVGSVLLMLYGDYRQYHSDGETVWYERLLHEALFGE